MAFDASCCYPATTTATAVDVGFLLYANDGYPYYESIYKRENDFSFQLGMSSKFYSRLENEMRKKNPKTKYAKVKWI